MKALTRSAAETRALAAAVASVVRAGDLVVLAGDLGAGKTTFAQGFAAGLGVDEAVVSPTFTIVREYRGRVPLAHVDLYRLERLQELHDLGFEELFDGERVVVVEWGDAADRELPADRLVVELGQGALADERLVGLHAQGASWRGRVEALAAAVTSFLGAGTI